MKKFSHYSVVFGKQERIFNSYIEAERVYNIVSKNIDNTTLYIFLNKENKVKLKGK
jgi:hypothetical protein